MRAVQRGSATCRRRVQRRERHARERAQRHAASGHVDHGQRGDSFSMPVTRSPSWRERDHEVMEVVLELGDDDAGALGDDADPPAVRVGIDDADEAAGLVARVPVSVRSGARVAAAAELRVERVVVDREPVAGECGNELDRAAASCTTRCGRGSAR